jgi:RecA-family ATPase
MTDSLGQFAQGVASWRKLMAAMPDEQGRWRVFEDAAFEIARYVPKGLDRVEAVDQLQDIATAHGLADVDEIQQIIADVFRGVEFERTILDDDEPPRTNGHDKTVRAPSRRATPYIPPEPADIPKRQWLYGVHYMRGVVTATVAPGGFGKTTLSLFEAVTMAVNGYRVWYISAEDDRDEIDRRIAAHCKHHDVKPFDLAQRLYVDDKKSFPLKIAKMSRTGVVFDDAALAEFESAIELAKIDVVILDPFISFHYLPENDTAAMDALVKRLGDIANRRQCCIELSHHVRKPSMGQIEITVYDARGAGAIVNAVRSCRVLNQMARTAAEVARINPEDRSRYIRIDSGKRNMAPPESARWGMLVNIEIANGDRVQALEKWSYPIDVTTDDDKTWLRVVLGDKALRASSQSADWIGHKVAERFNLNSTEVKADIITINRKIARWEKEGLIEAVQLPDENRKPRKHWGLGPKAKGDKTNSRSAAIEVDDLLLPLDE